MKDYSQFGQSLVLNEIFNTIGTTNKYGVEFGADDGFWLSNLRMFLEMGWNGLQIEGKESLINNGVKFEFITKDNINDIFKKYNVPEKFDLLSIDLDGNDYWIWKELKYEANVVNIEYNSHFNFDEAYSLEYNENHSWDNTFAYGASFKALCDLAEKKGYYLYSEYKYVDLIFVKKEFEKVLPSIFKKENIILPHEIFPRRLENGKKFIEV